mmetsp:Transcript_24014/g.52446  ORF Transcript_24014/g.52446 Transcript_24014/m.52446 type:complete len:336 (+) Transcript_24014:154-1161(+)
MSGVFSLPRYQILGLSLLLQASVTDSLIIGMQHLRAAASSSGVYSTWKSAAPTYSLTSRWRPPVPAVARAGVRCAADFDDNELMQSFANQAGKLARPPNVYVEMLQNISAPELVSGFAETAPREVQQAVRATVVSLLGNLPPQMYETSVVSTGQNVASLMYSMQMTGYMFRNAEYRRSLMGSLEEGGSALLSPADDEGTELPPVKGKIKVKLGDTMETEVEASAYMAELREEVAQLRAELRRAKESSSEAQGGGLLAYIQSLSRDSIKQLTASVSPEVLEAMQLLISDILKEANVGGDTFMETPGLKLRELLAWQLITGYRLRELEQKEQLKKLL